MALQALAAFAALTAAHHDVTVKVNSDAVATVATFYIHHGNQLLQQSQQVKELSWGWGGLAVAAVPRPATRTQTLRHRS